MAQVPGRERGMILLIVLLIISLITVMAVSLSRFGQITRQNIALEHQQLQAKWQLLGAEAAVVAEIQRQMNANGGMLPGPGSWLAPQILQTGNGAVRYRLQDLSACFNLNWLFSSVGEQQKANKDLLTPAEWFTQLLTRAGVGALPSQALLNTLQGYQFRDISQLLAVARIAPGAWQRLREQVCVIGGQNRLHTVNINGLTQAQLPLLQTALKKKIDADLLQQLLSSRPAKGWKNQDEIPPRYRNQIPVSALFRYNSTDYALLLEQVTGQDHWTLRSQLHYEKRKMHVVQRQFDGRAQ